MGTARRGSCGYGLCVGDRVPADTPQKNLEAMVDVATKSLWKEPFESVQT
jgi:hypothetical protein